MNTYQFEIEDARGTRDNECLLIEAKNLESAIKKAKTEYSERKKLNGMAFGLNLKISMAADMFENKNGGVNFSTQIGFNKSRVK